LFKATAQDIGRCLGNKSWRRDKGKQMRRQIARYVRKAPGLQFGRHCAHAGM